MDMVYLWPLNFVKSQKAMDHTRFSFPNHEYMGTRRHLGLQGCVHIDMFCFAPQGISP